MRWGLLAIAGVVACNSGQGVDIEVDAGGVTFDSVQLFITYDVCRDAGGDPCTAIGWPQLAQAAVTPVEGDVFVMKADDELVIKSTALKDGNGVLHLDASPGFENTLAIAVVAFNGSTPVAAEVLEGKHIPLHDQEHWLVQLHPVDPASLDMSAPAGGKLDHRALSWAREPSPTVPDTKDYAGCFAFQEWDGTIWKTKYFVPDTDHDCDGVPPDCDPTWNHAPGANGRCLTRLEALPAVCGVGNQVCVDESPGTCKVGTPVVCTPDLLCSCWNQQDPPSAAEVQACVRDKLKDAMSGSVPAAYCPYVVDPAAPTLACNVDNGEHMTFTVLGNCVSAISGDPVAVLRPVTQPFSGGSAMLSVGTAMFSVHATTYTTYCNVDLTWLPDTLSPGSGQPIVVAINFGARQIVVPVYVDFKSNISVCPLQAAPCMRLGSWPEGTATGDTMFQCANPG
ncbi:MAG TPA: hypothetical protein VLB44_21155 [Kofleriaceae bacterium]|nr:hypothetical protein [Kofleriaceae bacterium]